ncbi:MAG: hypothetical protein ACKVJQ_07655 [Alphaproteobacteria bacterium]|jgi:hypothetical protein
MTVSTPKPTDYTQYPSQVDSNFDVADRLSWAFAPHEQATPDMMVGLEPGAIFDGTTLTELAAQNRAAMTAPTTNPRIDRIIIDQATGVIAVVTGTEAASPTVPAIPTDKLPVAQVRLETTTTAITNADITDERALNLLGLGKAARGRPGAGFGFDADLLDGEEGTYYLDRANHTGFDGASDINLGDGLEDDGADNVRVNLDGTTLALSATGIKVATDGITAT